MNLWNYCSCYIFVFIFAGFFVTNCFASNRLFETERTEKINSQEETSLNLQAKFTCFACRLFAVGMYNSYMADKSKNCISAIVQQFCHTFNIEDNMVCKAIASQYKEEVLYVFGELLFSPKQFCGFIFPQTCGKWYNPLTAEWNVTFPDKPKPPVPEPKLPSESAPKLRVLHLTDIHFDKLYEVGSNVNCFEPLCCRRFETPDNKTFLPAGQWGSAYGKCDIPLWTVENLFQHLQKNETFDYIVWTGDVPPHNVWNQTKEDQLSAYDTLMKLFIKYFSNKTVFATVGNHESSPADSFPPHYPDLPEKFSIKWLYNALANHWTVWINKTQTSTIKKIASYIANPFKGLRIISLNTMYCYNTNFWLYLNETDPDEELSWLIEQLQEAEDAGDKVHIIGHVVPNQCLSQWSINYYKIINRYEDTVRAQFFGHTHSDEFSVFYENANYSQRATNMIYVAPSVTTFPAAGGKLGGQPSYRVYTVDGNYANSTWRVLNHETHFLNLTEANKNNSTRWQFEYDAKTAYNLKTLFPQEWSDLILTMMTNDTVFEKYNTFYNRQPSTCDESCKYDKLCSARSALTDHRQLCNDLSKSSGEISRDTILFRIVQRLLWQKSIFNIPDQCKLHPNSTKDDRTSTDETNRSACWLAFPNVKKCRILCELFMKKAQHKSKKLFHVRNFLCDFSPADCCIIV